MAPAYWSRAVPDESTEHRAASGRRRLGAIAGVVCVLWFVGSCTAASPRSANSPRKTSPPASGSGSVSGSSGPFVPADYGQTCAAVASWCDATTGRLPVSLERPLALPSLAQTGRCPVTQGVDYANDQFGGVALGRGPVQPLVVPNRAADRLAALRGVLRLSSGVDGWHQLKTLWFATPGYRGPVLIRGRDLNGGDPVAFGETPALLDPKLPPGPTVNGTHGYREWPGATWLRSPGCYAWQVDGLGFTRVFVFKAVW